MSVLKLMFASRKLLSLTIFVTLGVTAAAQKKGGAAAPASASPGASPTAAGASSSTAPVEVEWLAYGALDKILKDVADYTCGTTDQKFFAKTAGARVVVLDTPAIQALQAYDTFYAQAEAIRSAFVDMAPKAGAGGGIDDFADITGAVTAVAVATTSETSSSFTIQDPTAAIVLLGALHSKDRPDECKSAQYAGVYEVSEIGTVKTGTKVFKAKTDQAGNPDPSGDLADQKGEGTQDLPSVPAELDSLAKTRADTLMAVLGKPGATSNPKVCKGTATLVPGSSPQAFAISSTDPCVSAFNNLDGTYNAFLTALSTPNSTTGQSAESAAKQGYKLRALFESAKTGKPVIGIYLSVAAAGGTQQDRKFLLTAIFTGDWIRYSGGASLNVIIFKVASGKDSTILLSGLPKFRTQLTSVKPPAAADRKGLDEGSNLDQVFPSEKK
jgi:hypothetical protein